MEGVISSQLQKQRRLLTSHSYTSTPIPLEQLPSALSCASDHESKSFVDLQATECVDDKQPQMPRGYQANPSSSNQAVDTLLLIENPNLWWSQCHRFNEKSNAKGNLLSLDHSKLLAEVTCNSKVTSLYSGRAEEEPPNVSKICGIRARSASSSGKPTGVKTRLKWTADLHEKFVNCVNLLGGAEKATPKAILKLMKANGLTVVQVKSHLQKYRYSKGITESTEEKSDQRVDVDGLPMLYPKSGMQVKEILQMQLQVQRHLCEQIEIQQNLQQAIEEQGIQIKRMLEQLIKGNK